MRTVPRDKNFGRPENYAFSSGTEPVLRVEQGEAFAVETEDTYNGVLREDPRRVQPRDMKPYTDHTPFWYNPVCGPIYVNGVESGDVLAVRIVSIDNISRGTVATVPRAHHFAGLRGWEETDEPYTGVISNAGKSTWDYGSRTHTWEQRPFIGTLATAPDFEVLSPLTTSFGSNLASGGNLDCCAVAPGATVYLQSLNEGGLVFLGDVHASQGDGEVCGVANEVAATVTLECSVVKSKRLRNVRIVNDDALISVYCYRPIEEAFRQAMRDLILWLEEDYGLTRREAYLLMSVCPDFRLRTYQMCAGLGRLEITVGAEFPRYLLSR
jgi:amidase